MEEIRQKVSTFAANARGTQPKPQSLKLIRSNPGVLVRSYRELVEKVAALAYANPEFLLLYRGQTDDYAEDGLSTLYPTMFRHAPNVLHTYPLEERYRLLRQKEEDLIRNIGSPFKKRLSRSQILRWTILQHYEICPTPLLDVTHSLHVAASFAFSGAAEAEGESIVYVLGVPQISGSVTVVSDQSLQIVRLSSVCPPTTLRPYFQEGYLLATFPFLDTLNQKIQYRRSEVDCAKRLVAKFRLKRSEFWGSGFEALPNEALYPTEDHDFNRRILALRQEEAGR